MEELETTLSLLGCFPYSVVPGGSQLLSLQCWDLNLGLVHARQELYHQAMPPSPHFHFGMSCLQSPFPGEHCYPHISFYPGPLYTVEPGAESLRLEPKRPRSRTIVCDLGSFTFWPQDKDIFTGVSSPREPPGAPPRFGLTSKGAPGKIPKTIKWFLALKVGPVCTPHCGIKVPHLGAL